MEATRESILNEVMRLNGDIELAKNKIKSLYEIAKSIEDEDDDADGKYSYLSCIESYT